MKKTYPILMLSAVLLGVATLSAAEKACPENAETCSRMMAEKFRQRGWVGINMEENEDSGEVAITQVVPDSPAERAGFHKGDVLRALNGVDYTKDNEKALQAAFESFRPGGTATFRVERDGERLDIAVELEKIPEAILAQWIGHHVLEYHTAEAEPAAEKPAKDSP
jgi:predicted metalloprotease with PDZ domain